MQRRLALACPGDPGRRSGGTIYDRRLADGWRAMGWQVDWLRLAEAFPFPGETDLVAAERSLGGLPDGLPLVVDGLALGAMPELAASLAGRLRLVALVHHPLALETGLSVEAARRLGRSERAALESAASVLVTSHTTRDELVANYGVPPGLITVALPGVERFPLASGGGGGPLRLLAVGTVIPRKAMASLVAAMAPSRDLEWTLDIAGALDRSEAAVAELRSAIAAAGLEERVHLHGEIDAGALAALYARTDLMVSASSYEGFGMALAEGVAHGIPVVAVAGGAIADWLAPEAGLLVPPGDQAALATALARVLGDTSLRKALREGAIQLRERLPDWQATALAAEPALIRAIAS